MKFIQNLSPQFLSLLKLATDTRQYCAEWRRYELNWQQTFRLTPRRMQTTNTFNNLLLR